MSEDQKNYGSSGENKPPGNPTVESKKTTDVNVPVVQGKGLVPDSFDGMWKVAATLAASGLMPKDMGQPAQVFVALQMGAELGLTVMQSCQNIAVINGRPVIWGDVQLALVMAHPELEEFDEVQEGEGDNFKATCIVKRRTRKPVKRSFTMAQAQTAGLLTKNTWKNYPERMCQHRARSWALRDTFPDVLKGVRTVADIDPGDEPTPVVGQAHTVHQDQGGEQDQGTTPDKSKKPDLEAAYGSKKVSAVAPDPDSVPDMKPGQAFIIPGTDPDIIVPETSTVDKLVTDFERVLRDGYGNVDLGPYHDFGFELAKKRGTTKAAVMKWAIEHPVRFYGAAKDIGGLGSAKGVETKTGSGADLFAAIIEENELDATEVHKYIDAKIKSGIEPAVIQNWMIDHTEAFLKELGAWCKGARAWDQPAELTEDHPWHRSQWIGKRSGKPPATGFYKYIVEHAEELREAPADVLKEIVEKWKSVYPGKAFPVVYDLGVATVAPWIDEDPPPESKIDDDGQPRQPKDRELAQVRIDLISFKQAHPKLYDMQAKDYLRRDVISSVHPADLSLDECIELWNGLDEMKALAAQQGQTL